MKKREKNIPIQIRTAPVKIIVSIVILLCARIFLSGITPLNAAEQEPVRRIYPTYYENKNIYNFQRTEAINYKDNLGYDDNNYADINDSNNNFDDRNYSDINYNDNNYSDMTYNDMNYDDFYFNETEDMENDMENIEDMEEIKNTLFIGDSLTVGLKLYGGLTDADYFGISGIGVNGIQTSYMNGITLDTKLESMRYETIYIMLGINDIGINRETYLSSYSALLNHIREKQPDAVIIIQSILVVTASYTNSNPMFNNDEVRARNNALSEMADNEHIFYLDLNNYFMDPNGNLYNDISTDGCHLSADAYSIWVNALLNYRIPD